MSDTTNTATVDTTQNETASNHEEKEQQKQERTFTRNDISKMMAAEKAKWQEELDAKIKEATAEGERKAKMSKDELAKEEEAKRLDDLAQREAEIAKRELRLSSQILLTEEGLPMSFLDMVVGEDEDSTKANIQALRETFDKEVEAKVNERLKQKQPRTGSSQSLTKAEIMAEKDDAKRRQLIAENRDLFFRN